MPNPVKYADKLTKYLEDWQWRPLEEVSASVGAPKEIPDYIQKGYGEFMAEQAGRSAKGQMTPRDLIKAFGITQSSIGRRGLPHSAATRTGMKLPNEGALVRPEGAFAEWLGSPMGQAYLNAAERGEVDPRALRDIQEKFAPFGKQNQLAQQLAYGANLPRAAEINQALTGDVAGYRDWAGQFKGIDSAKTGFIGSLLGRGDLPTLDARQLNLQAPKPPTTSILRRGRGQAGLEAVDRLADRQTAMDMAIDPSLRPHYQHLAHHHLWDLVGNSETTHADLVKAMRNYNRGGLAK